MAPSVLQNGGFILGLIGAAALIAATAMNKWSVKDRQGDVVTSIYTYKGLWQDCETTTAGLTECRPLYGLLGFSGRTKLSYVWMCRASTVADRSHTNEFSFIAILVFKLCHLHCHGSNWPHEFIFWGNSRGSPISSVRRHVRCFAEFSPVTGTMRQLVAKIKKVVTKLYQV